MRSIDYSRCRFQSGRTELSIYSSANHPDILPSKRGNVDCRRTEKKRPSSSAVNLTLTLIHAASMTQRFIAISCCCNDRPTSHLRLYQHAAISNHNSFRVRLDKIVSAYSISKTHRDLYFSIGNGQPTVPVASAHFRSLLWQVTTAEVKVTVGGRPGDPSPP